MSTRPQCDYCKIAFGDSSLVIRHQAHAPACRKKRNDFIKNNLLRRRRRGSPTPPDEPQPDMEMEAMDVDAPTQELDPLEPEVEMRNIDTQVPRMMEVPDRDEPPSPADLWYTQPFPEKKRAGQTYCAISFNSAVTRHAPPVPR
jgi:hypothetical protein